MPCRQPAPSPAGIWSCVLLMALFHSRVPQGFQTACIFGLIVPLPCLFPCLESRSSREPRFSPQKQLLQWLQREGSCPASKCKLFWILWENWRGVKGDSLPRTDGFRGLQGNLWQGLPNFTGPGILQLLPPHLGDHLHGT